eukprot:scaffold9079_cov120-Cylindrotheca_fusiformis.AAC.4
MRTINEDNSVSNSEQQLEAGTQITSSSRKKTQLETDAPSDISSKTSRRDYAKCNCVVLSLITLIIVAVGFGVGWVVAERGNNRTSSSKDSTKNQDENEDDDNRNNKTKEADSGWVDSEDYFLFGGVEVASSTEAKNRIECKEFCSEYDAMQYLYALESCTCYANVSCLMPWGSQVDSGNYRFLGDLHIESKLDVCSQEYCQVYGNSSGLCFTGNSRDYQQFSLYGGDMKEVASTKANDLEECLAYCSPYDAASFLRREDCACYEKVECWLDWGDGVETTFLFGMVYSKGPMEICPQQYCDLIDDGRCFTANVQDYKEYTLHGADLVETNATRTSSEEACLDFCSDFDAASFRRPNTCTCYDKPDCWLSWGDDDQVDTSLFYGKVWSKQSLEVCGSNYCDVVGDGLCFTKNSQDYRQYDLHGNNMMEMASNKTSNRDDCLDFCVPYDAASFLNFEDCTCFNSVDCFIPWGEQVESQYFFGSVFSKRALEICAQDYCEMNVDGLCFTANYQRYREYSLFGNEIKEAASSSTMNNEADCLDFCAQYDAAQFLRFQDPGCTCFDQAECWLPWTANRTDTSGGSFLGFVYTKRGLDYCAFDFCSRFPASDLCAVKDNDQS